MKTVVILTHDEAMTAIANAAREHLSSIGMKSNEKVGFKISMETCGMERFTFECELSEKK